MEKYALSIGMKGLGYISVNADMTYKGPIDKFMTDEQKRKSLRLRDLQPEDVLYFISDEPGYGSQICRTDPHRGGEALGSHR